MNTTKLTIRIEQPVELVTHHYKCAVQMYSDTWFIFWSRSSFLKKTNFNAFFQHIFNIFSTGHFQYIFNILSTYSKIQHTLQTTAGLQKKHDENDENDWLLVGRTDGVKMVGRTDGRMVGGRRRCRRTEKKQDENNMKMIVERLHRRRTEKSTMKTIWKRLTVEWSRLT